MTQDQAKFHVHSAEDFLTNEFSRSHNNTGYLLVNLEFLGFWHISLEYDSFTRNEAQEQYSLLDTIFDYIFYFGPPGKYLYSSPQNPLHVGRRSRPTCSRFS